MCVIGRISVCVCSYSYLYYLHEHKLCRCARTTTPSRPGTQPLVMLLCGVFWRSIRNHYLLASSSCVRLPCLSMYVRTYRNSIMNALLQYYYDIITTAAPWGFFYSKRYLFWDNMTPIWKQCLAKFYVINLSIHMYIKICRISGEYRSK